MQNFIHEQNMTMFKRLLAEEPGMERRRREMILHLLEDAEAKQRQFVSLQPVKVQTHKFPLNRET